MSYRTVSVAAFFTNSKVAIYERFYWEMRKISKSGEDDQVWRRNHTPSIHYVTADDWSYKSPDKQTLIFTIYRSMSERYLLLTYWISKRDRKSKYFFGNCKILSAVMILLLNPLMLNVSEDMVIGAVAMNEKKLPDHQFLKETDFPWYWEDKIQSQRTVENHCLRNVIKVLPRNNLLVESYIIKNNEMTKQYYV